MPETNQNPPATVPDQPETKPPLRKSMPVVIALVAIVAFIGIANLSSLLSGNKKAASASAMPMRPASPNAQQVTSFETQQQLQAQRDADERQENAHGKGEMRHKRSLVLRPDAAQHDQGIGECRQEGSKGDLVAAVPNEVTQQPRTHLAGGQRQGGNGD